ncbi:unnamed protein product [Musa textilis]
MKIIKYLKLAAYVGKKYLIWRLIFLGLLRKTTPLLLLLYPRPSPKALLPRTRMDAAAVLLPFRPPECTLRRRRTSAGVPPRLRRALRRPLIFVSVQRICDLYRRRGMHIRRNATGKLLCSQVKLEDDLDDEACELVNGVDLVIGEGQDSISAYLLKAVKNNNGTGMLLLSDVCGFEYPPTRDFAYQVACHGYNVLVPDLFRGNPCKKGWTVDRYEHWLSEQLPERVARDIDTCAKWMIDEFMAAGISKKLGIIGFCFGGEHLMKALARDEQAYFGTGICFYGTNIDPSIGSNINVPVLFICGDNDPLCPVNTLHQIEKNIQSSRVVIYHGRGHGFAHQPESEEDDQAAEDAFAIMRNWLHDNLLVSKN